MRECIIEIWEQIKSDVPEKNRVSILKTMFLVLEDHDKITEQDLQEIKDYDKYVAEAVEAIYKEELVHDEEEIDDELFPEEEFS